MTSDFEQIPAIIDAAVGKPGSEFNFPFPEVLEVIRLCTINKIAVLGVEIFLVRNDRLYASGCSDYDLQITRKWNEVKIDAWDQYVEEEQCASLGMCAPQPSGRRPRLRPDNLVVERIPRNPEAASGRALTPGLETCRLPSIDVPNRDHSSDSLPLAFGLTLASEPLGRRQLVLKFAAHKSRRLERWV